MKTFRFVFVLLVFTLLASSCGSKKLEFLNELQDTFSIDDCVFVYLTGSDDPDHFLKRASELAQGEGFSIAFSHYELEEANGFFEYVSANPGSVFMYWLPHKLDPSETEVLGDFYEQALKYAPAYLKKAELINDDNSLRFMPTGYAGYAGRLCVLVRNDIYNEYGKKIQSASDLEDLLLVLKNRDPLSVP